MQRPNPDSYFMCIAQDVARRSTCIRRQIGAVIVVGGKIKATGYNGAPAKMRHCLDIGCMRDKEHIASGEQQQRCRAVHAEQNAIIQAGERAFGGTIYSLTFPCVICAKLIINVGIKRIVYLTAYPDLLALEMLNEARVQIDQFFKDSK